MSRTKTIPTRSMGLNRMPFPEFLERFKQFAARRRQYANMSELDDDGVDIDTEIPEDIAKEIGETLA